VTRSQYDEKMDALALKISEVCDGENAYDVGSACAVICAGAICEYSENLSERRQVLKVFIEVMHRLILEKS